jgi:PKD domain
MGAGTRGLLGALAGAVVGLAGFAAAVWSRFEGTEDIVEAALGRVPTSTWIAPATISGKGRNVEEAPAVAVDESGDAVVVWPQWNGEDEVIEGVSGDAASAAWGAPVQLSASGEEADQPGVALDSQGDAAAVWLRVDEASKVALAEAAGYDAAGPELNALTVPASGAVGQTLSFSVSPFDIWSALGATTWSFGDGASASGTSVSHSYAKGGTYTVAVTSLDALGNSSSAQATITITTPLIGCALSSGALPTTDTCTPSPPRTTPPGHVACAVASRAPLTADPCTPIAPVALTPRITSARLTHTRFRASKRATALFAKAKAKPPQGTAFHIALSEAAAVTIAFQHRVGGLRSAGRCVAPSAKLRRKHARRCSRTVTVGTLARAHEAKGPNSIPFSGRLGAKPLRPGAYRAVITARALGRTSRPVTLAFTVVA